MDSSQICTLDALLQLYCANDISKMDRNKLARICTQMRDTLKAKRAAALVSLANLENEDLYLQKLEHVISVLFALNAGRCYLFNEIDETPLDYIRPSGNDGPEACAGFTVHRLAVPADGHGMLEHRFTCCVERNVFWNATGTHVQYKYVCISTTFPPVRTMYLCTAPGAHIEQYLEAACSAENFFLHHKGRESNSCCGAAAPENRCQFCANIAYGPMTIAAISKPCAEGKWTLDNCSDSQGAFELLWFLRVLGSS